MISTAIIALSLFQQGDLAVYSLKDADGKPARLELQVYNKKLATTKQSPKKFGDPPEPWLFEYVASGYAANPENPSQKDLRHLIYSQQRKSKGDPAVDVGRLLLRLFDYNFGQLGLDHDPNLGRGAVHVYMCFGGNPGGEQRLDVDYQRRPSERVNTIYIYDLPSFTDPVEKLREVAHEYGHACIPPIGGFQTPEDWSNGYLGERVYIRHIRDRMRLGKFSSDDAMGATLPGIEAYVKAKVDPIEAKILSEGPKAVWWGTGPVAMDGLMGLALAVEKYVGGRAMSRSLAQTDMVGAKAYAQSVADTVMEKPSWRVNIPETEVGKEIWLPLGNVATEGATVIEKSGIWRKLKISAASYSIRPIR